MRNLSLALMFTIALAGCAATPAASKPSVYKPIQPTAQPFSPEQTVQTAATTAAALQTSSTEAVRARATGTPEDARRHILRGMAAIEMAKSNDDMALAEEDHGEHQIPPDTNRQYPD